MNIERIWKDPEYRESLGEAEKSQLPPHPAGSSELPEADLGLVHGGTTPVTVTVPFTALGGCWTFGNTVCNGTCPGFGTNGCC